MSWQKNNKCIKDESLQRFIDQELDSDTMEDIKIHISECKNCKEKIEEKEKLIGQLNNGLPNVDISQIKIPEIQQNKLEKEVSGKNRNLSWWSAAALFILFISLYIVKQTNRSDTEISYVFQEIENEIDANKPWYEQSSTIYILDESGEIIDKIENL